MKQIYLLALLLVFTLSSFAQVPANYYNSANGLTGYALKTQLKTITSTGHTARTYDQLYDGNGVSGSQGYIDTHSDINVTGGANYENDGTILDMYSENPSGTDPYNFTHGNDQCGDQSSEGDCYNREHLVPQSSFGSSFPMQSDIHHVIPTDGRVNNFRGSLPFADVASPNFTSLNGSKRGSSAASGYSGVVFEPIDEFKGDIARALLYFATRYEDTVDGYTSFDMFNGTNDQVFEGWAITTLLDWHNNVDPVDQRERDRNDAAYNFQNNANPFVDHPEYADMIWNPTTDTTAPTTPTNLVASNPTASSIDLTWTASTDDVAVTSYDIFVDGTFYTNTSTAVTTFTVTGLASETNYCFTIYALDAAGNTSAVSNQDCETTLVGSGSTNCASEDFENIPANDSQYTDRTWTGTDGLWNATRARTDQTINGRAILIDCRTSSPGSLTSPTLLGGIGNLTITTQKIYSGTDGTLDVLVNGSVVGTIPYSATPQTTTITGINVSGNTTVVIQDNDSGSARIGLDDLSWTCYSTLNVDNFETNNLKIYPNPIKGNTLNAEVKSTTNYQIYDILGKKILSGTVTTSNKKINVSSLKKGIYIIKIENNNGSLTKKLIKE